MLIVALGWHLYEITGDPWSLALVGLMQIIPVYVFFFVSGYVIDRFPRVWVVRACALVEALAVLGIAQILTQEDPDLLTLYVSCSCMGPDGHFTAQHYTRLFRI